MTTAPTDHVPGWSPWADNEGQAERHWSGDPANLSAHSDPLAGEPRTDRVAPTDQPELAIARTLPPATMEPADFRPARGPYRPIPVRDGATDAAIAGSVAWAVGDSTIREVVGRDDRRRRITIGVAVVGAVTNGAQVLIGFDRDDVDNGLGYQLDATDPFLVIACRAQMFAKPIGNHDAAVVQFISEFDYDDTPLPSDRRGTAHGLR